MQPARHPSRHRHRRPGAAQRRLLHPHARPAPGEEDRQFRRSRHLPSLLRRRDRASPARSSPSSRGSMSAPGRLGVGQTQETLFRVPEGAIGYWTHRFLEQGVAARGAEQALRRDGALIQGPGRHAAGAGRCAWRRERAGLERRRSAGRGRDPRLPRRQPAAGRGGADRRHPDRRARASPRWRGRARSSAIRRTAPASAASSISASPAASRAGGWAAARSTTSPSARRTTRRRPQWSQKLARDHRIQTTEQKDRNYFRSVYFREPGGILFEIATDDPGLCRRRAAWPRWARR